MAVYPATMSEEDMLRLELKENLERKDLTPSQRTQFASDLLKLEGRKATGGKMKTGNCTQSKTGSTSGFKPLAQEALAEKLKLSARSFAKMFKAYKEAANLDHGWPKLTKKEYDGFVEWMGSKANSM